MINKIFNKHITYKFNLPIDNIMFPSSITGLYCGKAGERQKSAIVLVLNFWPCNVLKLLVTLVLKQKKYC